MFESIRQFLAGLYRDRTLLLVLDDLHWADAPSLRLLEFLAPEIADSRLLLVGTYRANRAVAPAPAVRCAGRVWRGCRTSRASTWPA